MRLVQTRPWQLYNIEDLPRRNPAITDCELGQARMEQLAELVLALGLMAAVSVALLAIFIALCEKVQRRFVQK